MTRSFRHDVSAWLLENPAFLPISCHYDRGNQWGKAKMTPIKLRREASGVAGSGRDGAATGGWRWLAVLCWGKLLRSFVWVGNLTLWRS
jgi:hypothetical protein